MRPTSSATVQQPRTHLRGDVENVVSDDIKFGTMKDRPWTFWTSHGTCRALQIFYIICTKLCMLYHVVYELYGDTYLPG